jgi:hypothetical protein
MILINRPKHKKNNRYFYRKRLRRPQNRIYLGDLFLKTPEKDLFYEYGFN